MKKKTKRLLIAAGVVVLLLAVYIGIDLLAPSGQVEEDSVTFFETTLDDIQAVSVTSAQNAYTLEKVDDVWTCKELPGQELDQTEVRYRVNLIDKIPSVRYVGDVGESLESYGLNDPQLTIAITMADGTVHEILIGNVAADDNDYAVLAGEKNVCTIIPAIRTTLDMNPETWVVVEEETTE